MLRTTLSALFPYFPPCLSALAGVAEKFLFFFIFYWRPNNPSATLKMKNALKGNENISV